MGEKAAIEDGLSETEREKLRAEIRYALFAAKEMRLPEPTKTGLAAVFGYLSNGFVLLIFGSIITSILVPQFQQRNEQRVQQSKLMRECLEQFLLYTNSLWQEYYTVLPLTQRVEIDEATYLGYIQKIAEVKLKRYDAYEKMQALAVVFDHNEGSPSLPIATSLRRYQVTLNSTSSAIDKWLTGLYCTPFKRHSSPCASFDPSFDAYSEHQKIKKLVSEVGNADKEALAAEIVNQIKQL